MARFGAVKRFFGIGESSNENSFYKAFLSWIGGGYTRYDDDAPTYLELGFGTNPDVYSCVRQMSDKSSSIPHYIKKIEDKDAKSKLDRLVKSTTSLTPQQQIRKVQLENKAYEKTDLPFPIEKPNPLQSMSELISLYKTFMRTTGNCYFYLYSPDEGLNAGEPKQIYILPSHLVQIVVKNGASMMGVESPISHYMLIEGNTYVEFDAEDIIHVKYANPFYDTSGAHLYGLSPLKAALLNIQSSNEAIENNNKILSNGGAFGFLHSKGQKAMTEAQAKSIKDRLLEMDADPGRLSKIAGVSSEIGFTRISLTTDELKPFEFLKFDQTMICNVLGWSVKLLNNREDESGINNGAMQAEQRRVMTDNIMPDLNLLCDAFNTQLLPRYKSYQNTIIEFDYSELPEMQEDMSNLMDWVEKAINIGVMTRNEGRGILKLIASDNPQMDIITVKDDVIPLEEALQTDFTLDEPQGVS